MATRWRKAFCKSFPRSKEPKQNNNNQEQEEDPQIHQNSSSHQTKTGGKLRLFSSISNPSTPRSSSKPETTTPNLRCRTATKIPELQSADNTPKLQCRTSEKKSLRKFASTPSSPRSPFSILKNTLRLSKNECGVCLQSAKTGRGMAIYTAECSHSFHFPCISHHARKQGSLICPVCKVLWKDVPLLTCHKSVSDQDDVVEKTITTITKSTSCPSISAVKTNQAFNDDEPLVSPARFKPIPEAEDEFNEDANEEVEEFKGFFVNSTPSTPTKKLNSTKFFHDRKTQRNVEFKILPEAAIISIGRSHETFAVALRVKAPLPPSPSADGGGKTELRSNRAPIDLVTVLDIGGSMTNAKLHMLKRAMRLVISSLGSSDRLSIVAFSSDPQRLLPLRRMTPQGHRLARRTIDQLSIGQGKSVGSAMRIAAKVLEDRREKNPVASIILLSDGKDKSESSTSYGDRRSGLRKDESTQNGALNQRHSTNHVSATSTRFGHIEIPVHSYGFGSTDANSIAVALEKRVGGLLSVVVHDLRVQLSSSHCEITAVYSCNGRPTSLNSDSIRLGDLYAEEERELLIELRVPTSAMAAHHVMSVRCSYKDPTTGEEMYGRERALLVPRPHAVRSSDPRIERLGNVFVATRAVAETRRMVEYGELGSAQRLLMSARALVTQSGEEYVRWLEGEMNELSWRRNNQVHVREQELMAVQQQELVDENGEPLTPTSAWGEAERLAKVALMKKSLKSSGDLHGFENARF